MLGSSKCEVLTIIDLKDTFHSLRLTEESKNYCGILSYFGSNSYLYQRMPGVLFIPEKKSHKEKLEDLLNVLLKNGFKISPKKCQFFKKELQYMANIIFG